MLALQRQMDLERKEWERLRSSSDKGDSNLAERERMLTLKEQTLRVSLLPVLFTWF